jgi:uncharacterized protein
MIEYDAAKDEANIDKHGVSLARAVDMLVEARVFDDRYNEPRLRAYGTIDGHWYCLAYVIRGATIRAISLRRAHAKEIKLYV